MQQYAKLDAEFDYSVESSVYALLVVDNQTAVHLHREVERRHKIDLFEHYLSVFGYEYNNQVYVTNDTIVPVDDDFVTEKRIAEVENGYEQIFLFGLDENYIDAPVSVSTGYATIVIQQATEKQVDVVSSDDEIPVLPSSEKKVAMENNALDAKSIKLLNTNDEFKKHGISYSKLPKCSYSTSLAPLLYHLFRQRLGKRAAKSGSVKCDYAKAKDGDYFSFSCNLGNLYMCSSYKIAEGIAHSLKSDTIKYRVQSHLGGIFVCGSEASIPLLLDRIAKSVLMNSEAFSDMYAKRRTTESHQDDSVDERPQLSC